MRKSVGAVLVATTLLLGGAGCGGGGRPSVDEISSALQKSDSGQKLTKKQADCAAKVIYDSKISDKALQAAVNDEKGFKPSKADQKALSGVTGKLASCIMK